MATGQTAKRVDARERARPARVHANRERKERDNEIGTKRPEFFTAGDITDDLASRLVQVERSMGENVQALLGLGESADPLALDPKEIKRLLAMMGNPPTADEATETQR